MGSRSALFQASEACLQLPNTGSAEVLNQFYTSFFSFSFFSTAAYLRALFQAALILKVSATAKGKLSNVLRGKSRCF